MCKIVINKIRQTSIILFFAVLLFSSPNDLQSSKKLDSLKNELAKATTKRDSFFIKHHIIRLYYGRNIDSALDCSFRLLEFSSRMPGDTFRAFAYDDIANTYIYMSKYDSAIHYLDKSFSIYENEDHKNGIVKNLINKGLAIKKQGKMTEAARYYNRALNYLDTNKDFHALAYLYNNLGLIYDDWSMYDEALNAYMNAISKFDKIGNKRLMASVYNNIALLFSDNAYYEKALNYFRKSLDLKLDIQNMYMACNTYINIGLTYEYLNEDSLALSNINKGLQLSIQEKNKLAEAYGYKVLGKYYHDYENIAKALENYRKSFDIYKEIDSKDGQIDVMLSLSKILIEKKEYQKADDYLQEVIDYSRKNNVILMLSTAYDLKARIYKTRGNFKKALEFKELHSKYLDSAKIVEQTQQMNRIEAIYQQKQMAKENEILRNQNQLNELTIKNQSNTIIISVLIIILVILFFAILFFRYRSNKKMNSLLKQKNEEISQTNERLQETMSELRESQQKIVDDSKSLLELNSKLMDSQDKLSNLNKTKDKFFSIIAHDLKNPIGSFKQLTEALSEDFDKMQKEEIKEYIKLMKRNAKQLFELLENLLTWSRSQRDTIDFNPVDANLNKIIENVISTLNVQAENKSIKLKNEVATDLQLMADVNMLVTVLRNLISNAIKFTPENGDIRIYSEEKENTIITSIKDNGVGISKDRIDNLFNPGCNGSTKGTKNESGTGLGLILCKEFVEKNGGKIWVESNEENGSTFSFSLPKS